MMAKWHIVICGALIYLHGVFLDDYNSGHYLGTHVDLECESETPVDCIWKFSGLAIHVGDQYRYVFSNGSATTDCSIQVMSFHVHDVGVWECWKLGTDEYDGQLLNSYNLTLRNPQMGEGNTSTKFTIAVRNQWAVVLDCKFDTVLEECHWFRNGEPVYIKNRYKFVNFNQTGSDCSINITSIYDIDYGSWQCTTSANNMFGYRSSHVAWLISIQPEGYHALSVHLPTVPQNSIIEKLPYIMASVGDTQILPCKFQEPVHCVWIRNGQPIHVGHHYAYAENITIGSKTSNCTLKISNLILSDFGRWSCLGAADDSSYAIKSMLTFISQDQHSMIPTRSYLSRMNSETVVSVGENTTIYCSFLSNVYCDWTRNGISVKINNRYRFQKGNDSMPSKICTLNISPVTTSDAGNWSCAYMQIGTSSNFKYTFYNKTLTVIPQMFLTMNNIELVKMESLSYAALKDDNNTLICMVETRDKPPILNWKINDVSFPGEYKFIQKEDNVFLGKLYWDYNSTITFEGSQYYSSRGIPTQLQKLLKCEFEYSLKIKKVATIKIIYNFVPSPTTSSYSKPRITSYMPYKMPHMIGDTIVLNCTFNMPVNCSWYMNNTDAADSSGFQYIDASDGQNTLNCSIVFNFTEAMVNSIWQCANINTSTHDIVKSSQYTLELLEIPASPLIKWRHQIVNAIFFPELEELFTRRYVSSYSMYTFLECTSTPYVNRFPTLHWEALGINLSEIRDFELRLYTSTFFKLKAMKNATQLRCVLNHPALKKPKYAQVDIEYYRTPSHPVIKINDTIWKSNTTLPMNDKTTAITCGCQHGYPAANLSWTLDGKKIVQFVHHRMVDDFQFASTLAWLAPSWKLFNKSMQLECVAEHPSWNETKVALGSITFIYNTAKDQIQLLNEDRVLNNKESYTFTCISSQPINCRMKLNNTIVKSITPISTVPANDLIQGHIIHRCYLKLPYFGTQFVGKWQCTNGVESGNLTLSSNEVNLTPYEIPLQTHIKVNEHPDFYMNEKGDELILKHADAIPDLSCTAERSNPATSLLWVLNEQNITSISKPTLFKTNYYQQTTVLRWRSKLNFTQNGSVVLQCYAFFPTSEKLFQKAKLIISVERAPSSPVIFFNDKMDFRKIEVSEPTEFNGFKCISEYGNPASKLHWLVNGQGVSGQYESRLAANSTYTAELRWDPKNNDFLAKGPIHMGCVAIHPGYKTPITVGIQATLKNKGSSTPLSATVISPLSNVTETTSSFHYFGIALLSTFLGILTILTIIIFIRLTMRRLSGEQLPLKFCSFFSLFRRKPLAKESPLIKYEHCTGDSECQATIISSGTEF